MVGESGARSRALESGHVLVLAMLVLLVVTLAVALGAAANARRLASLRAEVAGLQLDALHDAAIAATLAELANRGTAGLAERPFGAGTIASRVLGTGRRRTILSCARLGARRRAAEVSVWLRSGSPPRVLSWAPASTAALAGWCD